MQAKTPRAEAPRADSPSTRSNTITTRGGLTRSTALSSFSFEEEGPHQRAPCHSQHQRFMTVIGELPWASRRDDDEEAPREEAIVPRRLPREIHLEDDGLFMSYFQRPPRAVASAPVDRRTSSAARSNDEDGRSRRRWFPLLMDHMG
ncbi:uncharacterized protein Tco025E_05074 [Trypanosoma conorhini]|uniref:Uncharacterized protein n=1 Tax=Trypanosoma conorhini TaxID=83891 RepID=A0A422PHE4_9TRYP|nr:uncharacterized protein Tco025E_05074 [Trypanosoma conorhini]RNF17145.1 hypothetical protein Tco025E_05074 [Trypanosoma conorhini]